MTFRDKLTEIEVRFGRTEPRTEPRNHGTGWTDKRGSRNSYLDSVSGGTAVLEIPVAKEYGKENLNSYLTLKASF